MSISKEKRDEIREGFREIGSGHVRFMATREEVLDFWLDILDRELEEQRKRIVGEIKERTKGMKYRFWFDSGDEKYRGQFEMYGEYEEFFRFTGNEMRGILSLPSLAAGQVEEVRAVDSQWDGEGGNPLGRFITGQRHYNTDNEEKNGTA